MASRFNGRTGGLVDDRAVEARYREASFDEASAFRQRMKGVEEYATSGAVMGPGARIDGRKVSVAHRLGDRFDVQVQDPFTKKMRTVVSHQYDSLGNRVATSTAWQPGNPESVAAVFGIPFVSAFGDLRQKTRDETDDEEYEKTAHDSYMKHRRRKAERQGLLTFVQREYGRVANRDEVPEEYRTAWDELRGEKRKKGGR